MSLDILMLVLDFGVEYNMESLLNSLDRFLIDSHKLVPPERVADLVEAGSDWSKHKNLRPIYAEISTSVHAPSLYFCSVDYIGYKPIFLDRECLRNFFVSAAQIGLNRYVCW